MAKKTAKKEEKQHLSESKETYLREGQKAYITINAAGAAALLAFLQAIWDKTETVTLPAFVLAGIAVFTFGVVVATCSYMARHKAFTSGAGNETFLLYRLAHRYIPIASIAFFCVGMLLPVVGGFIALCSGR